MNLPLPCFGGAYSTCIRTEELLEHVFKIKYVGRCLLTWFVVNSVASKSVEGSWYMRSQAFNIGRSNSQTGYLLLLQLHVCNSIQV